MRRDDLWVFGYGSLMWHAGFPVAERSIATLADHARSFCMLSIHHRGTEAQPGLVLALNPRPGFACTGVALRAEAGSEDETLAYLRERELISSAYHEQRLPIRLADGREVEAVAFVVDTDHEQYCGHLTPDEQAAMISRARGGRGPNTEYLWNTVTHLHELGIGDPELDWLARRVRDLAL
ncbi:gamma-glutamylcyclotransferase [Roseitranquillus sediminis]|uniref:gamma-glutamylcyclotransferase n=1 Tax=Roseitranquillus sediminis TaxID=2809051 RepID=UPI001D0C3050|nr:gamma-glutamylcyclotransferase [Roseitranquillus sediminis]MBM9595894.1 gamma-glutamylcyclotransferase [Roseitranquillus sediminis]